MRTIAYLTDTHLDEPTPATHGADERHNWQLALADLSTRPIDVVVFGGDIGLFSAYPDFFESLSGYPNLHVTPGNHDTSAQVRHFLPSASHSGSGFYHSEEDDDFKWIFVDSSTDKISPEQMAWLESQLQNCHKEILLFIHHPILAVDTPVDRKYPLENRAAFKDLLLRHTKKVTVFCGHYHIEDHTSEGNITQYVTPAISYQIKKGTIEMEGDATYFGYRLIEIDGTKIETEVITLYPDEF
jgi:3',5'-cyclic AMP phosphodiesterase CpdA